MMDERMSSSGSGLSSRTIKRAGIALIVVAVLVFAGGSVVVVDATKAANDYIEQANNQYQAISNNKDLTKEVVRLRQVWLGDIFCAKYDRTTKLEASYQALINNLRRYQLVMGAHNKLVAQFNSGVAGGAVLNSDLLERINKIIELMKKYYPEDTGRIQAMVALSQRITASTTFAEIGADMNRVLGENEKWLDGHRQTIERARVDFQTKLNAT